MAHFYGTVSGQARTNGTRRGSVKSGLTVSANGWSFGVDVTLNQHKTESGELRDEAHITLTSGSYGGDNVRLGYAYKEGDKFYIRRGEKVTEIK